VRPIARLLHFVLAWLLVVGLVVQVWLAGRGVFDTTGFDPHRSFGFTLSLLPVLLLILGVVGAMGRRVGWLAFAIFVLFIAQSVLVAVKGSYPAIAALHPVNGFLILLLAIVVALDSTSMRSAPA
jgi:hypothetical protein